MHDLDKNGTISYEELDHEEVHILERKMKHQRKMAYIALISMILFTVLLFSPIIPDTRIQLLDEVSGLFYISMASIVGAYMGFTSWMSRK